MNKYLITCIAGFMFISTSSYASGDRGHENTGWNDILSMNTGITRHAQAQIRKVGKTDTTTPSGKKAKRLIS